MEWIPYQNDREIVVKRILVYSNAKLIHVLHWSYGDWCLTECEYPNGNEFTGESVKFTHWMPLPEPPQNPDGLLN